MLIALVIIAPVFALVGLLEQSQKANWLICVGCARTDNRTWNSDHAAEFCNMDLTHKLYAQQNAMHGFAKRDMMIGDPVTSKKTPPKKPPMALTILERELVVEMGYHLALAMWRKLGKSDPEYQSVLNGYKPDVSVYRRACLILSELDVVYGVGGWQYRFAMPLDRVREHLRTFVPTTLYSLEEIIGNFLWVTAGYDNWVSEEREPFEVAHEMQAAMQAFAGLGLATSEPKGFVWTDKIAPIMIAEHLWSKEGESFTTLQRQKNKELTERIWNSIPVWRRHVLARLIIGRTRLDATHYLFWRWDDDRNRLRFTSRPKTEFRMISSEFDSAAYEIIDRLIAILKRHPF